MPENTLAIRAGSTSTSLRSQAGNSRQPSGRDVARPCLTQIGLPSCENSDAVLILMAMLASITKYTTSGDVLQLGVMDAVDICASYGLAPEQVRPIAEQFLRTSRKLRNWNTLAFD